MGVKGEESVCLSVRLPCQSRPVRRICLSVVWLDAESESEGEG